MIDSIFFLPHGMQLIPDLEIPYNEKFRSLHDHMLEISKILEKEHSEIIILITPHGLNLEDRYLIYEHNIFVGNYYRIVERESVVHGKLVHTKEWRGDVEKAVNFKEFLQKHDLNVASVIQGGTDYPLTLAWGETVPLYYIPENLNPSLIIIGVPRSRHDKIHEMQSVLKTLGRLIFEYWSEMNNTCSIIFSGDLSHTHLQNGPYGFHESSKAFDELVAKWSVDNKQSIFEEILSLQNTALACGMAGISMLQGIFNNYKAENLLSFYHLPTYFGMIINHWKI